MVGVVFEIKSVQLMPRGTFTFRKVRDGAAMAASGILARRVQGAKEQTDGE